MNPMIKGLTELIVSVGVGTIVENAIKATTPANTALARKIAIGVGSIAMSSLVASKVSHYIVDQINETTEQIKEALAANKSA